MKKIIAFILFAALCNAQPPRHYGYGSVNMMAGYPMEARSLILSIFRIFPAT
jgi:hypothetical protein